ncbi:MULTISPECIES: homogentisate 1,2-dioxygenase [Variovorax]|jgi:homogentisate 1,2-dioxygenase|uniref:homogentisate 1,2-dioxygenase n=1 Tax=Variovorax TaxID=34072 RepID=UPI00086E3CD7|nr:MULTISPECIES: homogentisate 1,2-dioxygenase [Variovorax]MBN8754251.1 homogentisate 1,2-dioxygenase [Variovorax sp.]ODU18545.1 MAG: homogentisate 1,2-dioxygenase [Variovorax sp. SCN 67-85]ODV25472.1 MAG: homogentisate 1,2-dioxygenase [Variovorax sp. SCN 67-20]OJZ05033.1 MAG: homogentisate 1,2-dioxygenase [Variovorax sp. 67-131]UKI09046.1 homogentisate 1,2-dioxygenase [Variovorax paradoxus]
MTQATPPSERRYQSGFGNEYASEAVPGALPQGRNNPQRGPLDLYTELISGTAFTAPRHENRRTWLYRRQPSVVSGRYQPYAQPHWTTGADREIALPPEPLRWHPQPLDGAEGADFIDGMHTIAANGDAESQVGIGSLMYLAGRSMERRAFVNADGEMLLVPQQGRLVITTELGVLDVKPGEIAVLPRGMAFKVALPDGLSRGYVCENYGAHFRLPELGPIGSNGLANARDFQAPVAAFETEEGGYEIVKKFGGRFWQAPMKQSPFNVVAWHGNLSPVKYDTAHFMVIGSISFDHPDPSIFTVLTSPSDTPGTANCDFVIFPPRWMVMENTFRPPWFHRNLMSEFMGLVLGEYDAKPGGFKPGGASLHNCMVPHGPDEEAFDKATRADLKPHKLDNTLAFMFESRYRFIPTNFALKSSALDTDYADCWAGLKDQFKA